MAKNCVIPWCMLDLSLNKGDCMYIDLTHTVIDNLPSHPQDVPTKLTPTAVYKEHGVANHALYGSVHMGTHIDAPGHFTGIDKKITDYSVDVFIGNGICIDVHGVSKVNRDVCEKYEIHKSDIVLFYTGWDLRLHESDYFTGHPVITESCAQYLADKKVKMVGVDFPSVDQAPWAVHKLLLRNDILIIENLTNLSGLVGKKFEIIALPLKIDAHGAPARVIARIV